MVSSLEYIAFEHNATAAELVRKTYDTPPLAFVHSYGCQQNVNDGEKIKGVLQDVGYGLCDNVEHADLILFNTCAVREHAEQRVFGNVGALKGLKENVIIGKLIPAGTGLARYRNATVEPDKAIRDTIYPNFGLGGEGTDSSFGDTDLSDVDFSNIDFGDLKLGDDFNPDDFLDDNGGQTDLGDTL